MDLGNGQGHRTNAPVPPVSTDSVTGPQKNPPNPGDVDSNANVQATGNTDRQATYCGGFTVIPPNDSRRNKITSMAQKEEQDLQRYRESQRVTSVQLPPERLGGHVTLAEARQKQLEDLKQSKWQKKLKKEEMDRERRQAEEQKLQQMKAVQRAKAERLNKRRGDEEQRRKEELGPDHLRKNEDFFQHLESSSASSVTFSFDSKTATETTALTKSLKDVQLDHRRVNAAFLDKLESRGDDRPPQREEVWGSVGQSEWNYPTEPTGLFTDPEPEPSSWWWTEGADGGAECEQALVQLMSRFPDCSRAFLEDILDQCAGDYQRASQLLDDTS
ncbi:uncharacterized protein epsti1 isoform 1-T1 [Synchiropus picturatus]